MSVLLTQASLKAFFDAHTARYKTAAYGTAILGDGYLPSWMLDYQLCTPDSGATANNPVSVAPSIPKPYTVGTVAAAISSANLAKLAASVYAPPLIQAIDDGKASFIQQLLNGAVAGGIISSADATAAMAVVNAVQADPAWTATVAICDLQANFVDGQGKSPLRLGLAKNPDGSATCPAGGIAFINQALGRS